MKAMKRSSCIAVVVAGMTLSSLSAQGPATSAPANPESLRSAEAQRGGEHDGPKTITLNIKKGDIGDALRLVAEQGGLNLVVGPDVKGEVSVYLAEATLDSALKAIAVNNGFAYIVEDGVITVARAPEKTGQDAVPTLVTRIFNLRAQDAERVKDALEFALTKFGKMKVLNQNSQGGYGVQRLSSLGGDLNGSGSGGSGSVSSGSGAGNSGAPGAGGMASGPMVRTGQELAHNARTLVVTDTVESVERIAGLVADLDRLPPQVLIEARIVEMSTDLQRQLGIDWNMDVLANGPLLNHEWPIHNKAGFASGNQIQRRFDGSPYQSAGLSLGTVDFSQLTALVKANQSDTAIRLLANPRLLVYNNHSASILVGERYPILQANVSNFGTATESLQTYIPVGVQLEVTPTIMVDGAISMLVHPATSALGDDVVGSTGLHVARIRTRELDTRVIMRDGQTIVLGGLISDRKTHQSNKVPGLGDVPILDAIFRQENPHAERVDLLIFLTAQVECAAQTNERDQQVYDTYKPHFKHIEHLQDVPLHFEVPTEYEIPKPMFTDPPGAPKHGESEEFYEDRNLSSAADIDTARPKVASAGSANGASPSVPVGRSTPKQPYGAQSSEPSAVQPPMAVQPKAAQPPLSMNVDMPQAPAPTHDPTVPAGCDVVKNLRATRSSTDTAEQSPSTSDATVSPKPPTVHEGRAATVEKASPAENLTLPQASSLKPQASEAGPPSDVDRTATIAPTKPGEVFDPVADHTVRANQPPIDRPEAEPRPVPRQTTPPVRIEAGSMEHRLPAGGCNDGDDVDPPPARATIHVNATEPSWMKDGGATLHDTWWVTPRQYLDLHDVCVTHTAMRANIGSSINEEP